MDPGDASFSSECDWPLYKKEEGGCTAILLSIAPTMKTLVGVRRALKELYALKNIDLI